MHRQIFLGFLLLLPVLMLAGCGCGDDDDDNDDGAPADDDVDDDTADDDTADDDVDDDTTDDDTADDDTTDDDTTDDDTGDDDTELPPTDPISVELLDVISDNPIVGATCELIRSTGTSFDPAITTTSDAGGLCEFNQKVRDDLFSMKITHDDYVDSYAFLYPASGSWYLKLVTPAVRAMLALAISVTLDDTKGVVSGAVDWDSGSDFSPVGCAEVTDSAGSDIFYFDNGGLPTTGRTDSNPANGYFLAVNVDPAEDTFTANADGEEIEKTLPTIVPDAVNYMNLIYDNATWPTDPEPAGCI